MTSGEHNFVSKELKPQRRMCSSDIRNALPDTEFSVDTGNTQGTDSSKILSLMFVYVCFDVLFDIYLSQNRFCGF